MYTLLKLLIYKFKQIYLVEKPQMAGKVKLGGFELGKQLAEKSKGLFSADDWQCKT